VYGVRANSTGTKSRGDHWEDLGVDGRMELWDIMSRLVYKSKFTDLQNDNNIFKKDSVSWE
jgi:hypothetical protein